jgi:hypothetical protein
VKFSRDSGISHLKINAIGCFVFHLMKKIGLWKTEVPGADLLRGNPGFRDKPHPNLISLISKCKKSKAFPLL